MYDHIDLHSLFGRKLMFFWSMGCVIHSQFHLPAASMIADSEAWYE